VCRLIVITEGADMTDNRGDEDVIRGMERQRYRAMRDGDVGVLDSLFADELLAKIRSQELRFPDVHHRPDEQVIVHGDTAIATGLVTGVVYVHEAAITLHNRALAVWSRQRGRWQLLAYQSTPIPAGQLIPAQDDPQEAAI
jgi:predicted solute-binding protein